MVLCAGSLSCGIDPCSLFDTGCSLPLGSQLVQCIMYLLFTPGLTLDQSQYAAWRLQINDFVAAAEEAKAAVAGMQMMYGSHAVCDTIMIYRCCVFLFSVLFLCTAAYVGIACVSIDCARDKPYG